MKGITPQESRGPGFAQKTNPGTGMSKDGGTGKGGNSMGGGDMSKFHDRPATGNEFSTARNDGTGMSK